MRRGGARAAPTQLTISHAAGKASAINYSLIINALFSGN